MKTLIIQTSPYRTASTLLVNALYGLIPALQKTKIIGFWDGNFEQYFGDVIVLKHHNVHIDQLILEYNKYKLYFVCSERKDHGVMIDRKFKFYSNVCVFDFNELNETPSNQVPNIIQNISAKLSVMLQMNLDVAGGVNRVNAMNVRYKEIYQYPFDYIDEFFEIHGSHRSRKCFVKPHTEISSNLEEYLNSITLRNKLIYCIKTDLTISHSLRLGKYWEVWMLRYLQRFYRAKSNIVDVGGYIGTSALLMSEILTPGNKIYTFEPVFNNILLKNVKANSLDNTVVLYPFGLGNQNSIADVPKLDLAKCENFGGISLIHSGSLNCRKMKIPICKLDDFWLNNVSLIKIDVENMEIAVLEGAIELITNYKPAIIIATHDLEKLKNSKAFAKLSLLGYVIRNIAEGWHDYLLHIPPQTYIPKEIHICQKDMAQLQIHANDWKLLNPEYNLNLYDDDACRSFLLNEFSQKHLDLFDFLVDGPIKADFWRICILYKHGGVYVDSDVQPLVPIHIFLEDDVDFFTCTSYSKTLRFNPNVIMAKPGDTFLQKCIETYLQMYDSKIEYGYWTYSIMTIFDKLLHLENYEKISGVYYDARGKKYQIAQEIQAAEYYDDHNVYKGFRIFNNRYKDYDFQNHTYRI
jgi:FkbM family methyltransferase